MHFGIKLVVVLLLLIARCFGDASNQNQGLARIKEALDEYKQSGIRPLYLDAALENYQASQLFRKSAPFVGGTNGNTRIDVCGLCEIVTDFLIYERRKGMTDVQMEAEIYTFCTQLNIEHSNVCKGFIELNLDIWTYIIDSQKNLKGKTICAIVLQNSNCKPENDNDLEWNIQVPEGSTVAKKTPTVPNNSFNILQISDIHYDPLYTINKSNNCKEPLCCQVDQLDGNADDGSTCGYWSDYKNSDVPMHTVEETLQQINTTHEFDYVYFTGDIISHRVWSTSIENNTRDIKLILGKLRDEFKVPVYPILGNHEPNPHDVWNTHSDDTSSLSTDWLLNLVAEEWTWLPTESKATIVKGGFYTVSPRKGFRIIALNSNVAYVVNWWLFDNTTDPYNQLAWLTNTLKKAEENMESVHILSHIPTGNDFFLRVWAREYNKIVNRFANTITGQFNGHTHRDEFQIFYNTSDSTQAVNVAWNGASVTTFTEGNPSYKLYQIDAGSFDVLDYEEWTFNLTLANVQSDQSPKWYKLYSFKDTYDVEDLQPETLNKLVEKMAKNHTYVERYHVYYYRNSDIAVNQGCDHNCQKNYLCNMVTSVQNETTRCDFMKSLYDQYI